MITVEVCVASPASARVAQQAGAKRVELCAALPEGGTTPSLGMVQKVLEAVAIPVFPIIRPRGGDFVYSDEELEVMLADIDAFVRAGVHGFSLGVLTREGRLDKVANRRLIEACQGKPVTLHRAFDRTCSLDEELEVAVDLGFERILTSGGEVSAPQGAEQIARLVKQAGGRIIIMAGAGVRPENAVSLLQATGVRELHGTFQSEVEGDSLYQRRAFPSYYTEKIGEQSYKEASAQQVSLLIDHLKDYPL